MSMIDRYQKKGGFVQLLNLLETTGKEKQEKFLKLIGEESPVWETEVKKRLLSIEKVFSWNTAHLAEIFPRVPVIQLAAIVGGLPPDKGEIIIKLLNTKEKRQIEEQLEHKKPAPGETSTAIMKLFAEIRKMESEGVLKFEKVDPSMIIPENFEDQLGKAKHHHPPADQSIFNEVTQIDFSPHKNSNSVEPMNQASPPPSSTPGLNTNSNVAEELSMLRRRLVQLTQENNKLQTENQQLKAKLESIRKIA